ncbi:MAG: hypothetical protein JKY50_18030 [Oleispira sp.]|nr:hypothetical protein [Oleispira sp.]MBL4880843.1 hypothetical protein [Oleispira sp.]
MKKADKKDAKLAGYNENVGGAYHVSRNGVLSVDLENENFREEFIKQLQMIRTNRDKK